MKPRAPLALVILAAVLVVGITFPAAAADTRVTI